MKYMKRTPSGILVGFMLAYSVGGILGTFAAAYNNLWLLIPAPFLGIYAIYLGQRLINWAEGESK